MQEKDIAYLCRFLLKNFTLFDIAEIHLSRRMTTSEFYHITAGGSLEKISTFAGAVSAMKDDGYVWFNYRKATRDELSELIEPLGLHPLSLEDCTDENQVPKLDEFPSYSALWFSMPFDMRRKN